MAGHDVDAASCALALTCPAHGVAIPEESHGSEPNRSGGWRVGLAIRYIPTDVRQLKVRDSATLVRGVNGRGYFDLEPPTPMPWGGRSRPLYWGTDKQAFRA